MLVLKKICTSLYCVSLNFLLRLVFKGTLLLRATHVTRVQKLFSRYRLFYASDSLIPF